MSYGKAYVFYPEVSDECTTMALLLDIDPIDLARGKLGSNEGGLFDYVNDRPYTSTSFMSTAIARIFSSAMNGRCDKKQSLADTPLNLTAKLFSLKDGGYNELAKQLFEPLGYEVSIEQYLLDDKFQEWGNSPYINLTISNTIKLCDLLNHIYVLIPVFDKQKHYYIESSEINKLLTHGQGWLENHPYKEKIVNRYFSIKKDYAKTVLENFLSNESKEEDINSNEISEETTKKTSLNNLRLQKVKDVVLSSGASSVIDLGCGEGKLTELLLKEPQIKKITACDVSISSLEKAAKRLHIDNMPSYKKDKLTLMQASLTYKDTRFEGFDCACIVEVIEHIDATRIPSFERIIFEFAAPKTVIITTPNKNYNVNYKTLCADKLRHNDHRFEWSKEEFENWANNICKKFSYTVELCGIGEEDEQQQTATQMGVFTRNG